MVCEQKQELLEQLKKLSREVSALQREQLEALLANAPSNTSLRMENARELRRVLMKRLRFHIDEHKC